MLRSGVRLVLIRHGETDWNAVARLQGLQDIPLNEKGRTQARGNGGALPGLCDAIGRRLEEMDYVASPLSRARETMELVRLEAGLARDGYRIDPKLAELTFGDWEGLTLKELKISDPDGHAGRKADRWGHVPPNGESYEMLSARIADWLPGVDRDTVAVSHGGVLRVLFGLICGTPPDEVPLLPTPQDRFVVFDGKTARWVGGVDNP